MTFSSWEQSVEVHLWKIGIIPSVGIVGLENPSVYSSHDDLQVRQLGWLGIFFI